MSYLQGLQAWSDFKSHVGSLNKKEKGDAFEALTLSYLKLDPQYITLLKDVWLLKDVPIEVRDHLNLPDRDEGIDLIARTREGTYWAIQCKYVEDEDHSLSRKALSTFTDLAFTVCRNIDYALICTTADRFSHKLTLYGERLGFLAGDVWRNLADEFFAGLGRMLQGQKVSLVPREPRPHQQRAILNAENHFITEKNTRGKLILPCGTGKSLASFWIAEALKAKTILVAVPSLALVRQTLKEWLRESVANGNNVQWIAVCSDESVAQQKQDDVAVLTQDLGIRVHTDPKEIAGWLNGRHDGLTVVFTTYQSGRATAEATRLSGITFDLAIFDEAHKTVGKKNSLFSHLLFDENISIRNRVFMTATERRYLGNSDQIASMTDPALYGDTFELLTFKEALETDPPILSDYRIVTITVTRAEVRRLVQENLFVRPDKGRWDDDVEAETLAVAIALRKAIQKYPIRHAVSFHSSISRANVFKSSQDALTKAFPNFGHLETFHVSGKTPTAKRSRELERFVAATPSLVTNARCLTEGVDVPGIDCILFADPKSSTVDIVQAVGRALRRAEGKDIGYVIVPVLIDEEIRNNPEAQYEAFAPVLNVLRSLAGNDERIVEYFRSVAEGRKAHGSVEGGIIDIPEGIFIDGNAFVESIELKLWSRLAKLSWRPFEEARNFSRSLNLKSGSEWLSFCNGEALEKGILPEDIPASPEHCYKGKGWQGMGDWLGTGTVANHLRVFLSYEDARTFVHKLGLGSNKDWRQYCNEGIPEKGSCPNSIPTNPNQTYEDNGWQGWGDWLGTGKISSHFRDFLPFKEARCFARSLGLKSWEEWRQFAKGERPEVGTLPEGVPAAPMQVYRDSGWKSMGDWLGTGATATRLRKYQSFKQARAFVRTLGLKSEKDWRQFTKGEAPEKGALPEDIPANPNQTYKDVGWKGIGDWLGTGTLAPRFRKYRSYKKASDFAQRLGLQSWSEWKRYCKGEMPEKGTLPKDIPASPAQKYKGNGWQGVGDWLGTGVVATNARQYRSFEEARFFSRNLDINSRAEWNRFCEGGIPEKGTLPEDIPRRPERAYKDTGWGSWSDWLGTVKK